MRRKIVHAITRQAAGEGVYERVAAADDILGVRISGQEIAWPRFLRREYLPYEEIVWAYLSIKETEMQTGEFDGGCLVDARLVLFDAQGRHAFVKFQRPSHGEIALDMLKARAPHIAYGFTDENRAKFPFDVPQWQQ